MDQESGVVPDMSVAYIDSGWIEWFTFAENILATADAGLEMVFGALFFYSLTDLCLHGRHLARVAMAPLLFMGAALGVLLFVRSACAVIHGIHRRLMARLQRLREDDVKLLNRCYEAS